MKVVLPFDAFVIAGNYKEVVSAPLSSEAPHPVATRYLKMSPFAAYVIAGNYGEVLQRKPPLPPAAAAAAGPAEVRMATETAASSAVLYTAGTAVPSIQKVEEATAEEDYDSDSSAQTVLISDADTRSAKQMVGRERAAEVRRANYAQEVAESVNADYWKIDPDERERLKPFFEDVHIAIRELYKMNNKEHERRLQEAVKAYEDARVNPPPPLETAVQVGEVVATAAQLTQEPKTGTSKASSRYNLRSRIVGNLMPRDAGVKGQSGPPLKGRGHGSPLNTRQVNEEQTQEDFGAGERRTSIDMFVDSDAE